MSCVGCRVLRKGCSDKCPLRSSLGGIEGQEAQGHATVFLSKFFGRAGLTSFCSGVPEAQRPALFQSLLYEACGRTINPVYGSVGLLWSGKWHLCQAAVEKILGGGQLGPADRVPLEGACAPLQATPKAVQGGGMMGSLVGSSLNGGSLNGGPLNGGALNGGSLNAGALNGGALNGTLKGGSLSRGQTNGGSLIGGSLNGASLNRGSLNGGSLNGGALPSYQGASTAGGHMSLHSDSARMNADHPGSPHSPSGAMTSLNPILMGLQYRDFSQPETRFGAEVNVDPVVYQTSQPLDLDVKLFHGSLGGGFDLNRFNNGQHFNALRTMVPNRGFPL